jgi:hypothetical protein
MIGVCINCSAVFELRTGGFSKTQNRWLYYSGKENSNPKGWFGGSLIWKIFKSLESTRGYNKVCVIHNDPAINLISTIDIV